MMLLLQNMFLMTVPCSTILTTIAMLLPYWWSSDTLQVGLWRARSVSSPWLLVEPQLETQEGKILLALQILSFTSVLLADISGLLWVFILLRRHLHSLLKPHILLLTSTVLTYLCLSVMVYLVWQTTKSYTHLINVSYSFYIALVIVFLHSLTFISITINLLTYRSSHHTIQPSIHDRKVVLAFSEPIA